MTYVNKAKQREFKDNGTTAMRPDSILRSIVELSDGSRYAIGVYHERAGGDPACVGTIEPLDRSAVLAADPNSPWSPMDDREPSEINLPADKKPATRVQWKTAARLPSQHAKQARRPRTGRWLLGHQ